LTNMISWCSSSESSSFTSISLNSLLMASFNACPIRDSSTTYLAPRHRYPQIWDFVLCSICSISSARLQSNDRLPRAARTTFHSS
jgi:hypothetical protein